MRLLFRHFSHRLGTWFALTPDLHAYSAGPPRAFDATHSQELFLRRFLNLWIVLGLLIWGILAWWLPQVVYVGQVMVGVGCVARLAIHRGHWAAARWLFIGSLVLTMWIVAWRFNGVRTPVLLNATLLVMLSGWLLGRRAMLVLALLMGLYVLGLWQLELHGLWQMRAPLRPTAVWAMSWSFNLATTAIVVSAMAASYQAHARQEAALRHEVAGLLAFNESVIAHLPVPMRVFRADGQCISANAAYARLAGVPQEALLAQNFNRPQGWQIPSLADEFRRVLQSRQPHTHELATTTSSGRELWLSLHLMPFDLHGEHHLLVQCIDYSERKQHERSLQHMAYHDALTHLPNRRLLLERLEQAVLRSQRSGQWGAVLLLDLNAFKQINDDLGHEAGDTMLVQVAQRLQQHVRATDTVARLGGDEFVVLLENIGDGPEAASVHAQTLRDKLLASLQQPYHMAGERHSGGASIGLHLFHGDSTSVTDLLRMADMAMYRAKRGAPPSPL